MSTKEREPQRVGGLTAAEWWREGAARDARAEQAERAGDGFGASTLREAAVRARALARRAEDGEVAR